MVHSVKKFVVFLLNDLINLAVTKMLFLIVKQIRGKTKSVDWRRDSLL